LKILLLDIETAPNLVHTWGLYNQNVGHNQIIDSGYTLCWAAKWYKEKRVYQASILGGMDEMLAPIHDLLEEADAVVSYNGKRFDIPTLNKEFIKHGYEPPAPYKQIDLLVTARQRFKFASNRLDYVAKFLGLGAKITHKGHDLWKECMAGNKKSMREMMEYNEHDVILLERVYDKMLPWIKGHANHSLYSQDLICPNCGGKHYQRRGEAISAAGAYARYQCQDCGTWFRGNKSETRGKEKFIPL